MYASNSQGVSVTSLRKSAGIRFKPVPGKFQVLMEAGGNGPWTEAGMSLPSWGAVLPFQIIKIISPIPIFINPDFEPVHP